MSCPCLSGCLSLHIAHPFEKWVGPVKESLMCPPFSYSKERSVVVTTPSAAAKTTLAFTGVPAFLSALCTALPSHLDFLEREVFLSSSSRVEWYLSNFLQICLRLFLEQSALYSLLHLETPWQSKCFTAAVFPHWAVYLAIFALSSDVKWVYFRFLPLAPFLSSSKTFCTALFSSLLTASSSSTSLLMGKDCFWKNLNNVAIPPDRYYLRTHDRLRCVYNTSAWSITFAYFSVSHMRS